LVAAHEFDARRRMISKTFYQQLRSSERQSLVGPPESMREHVVAASKAMRNGHWSACTNFIINEKMNAKVMLISVVVCIYISSTFLQLLSLLH
jgi:translation initiation factor 3 subunit C